MIRLLQKLADPIWEAVFKVAELRHPRLPPKPVDDDEIAAWLHAMDVRTRTEILRRAIDSKTAEHQTEESK